MAASLDFVTTEMMCAEGVAGWCVVALHLKEEPCLLLALALVYV